MRLRSALPSAFQMHIFAWKTELEHSIHLHTVAEISLVSQDSWIDSSASIFFFFENGVVGAPFNQSYDTLWHETRGSNRIRKTAEWIQKRITQSIEMRFPTWMRRTVRCTHDLASCFKFIGRLKRHLNKIRINCVSRFSNFIVIGMRGGFLCSDHCRHRRAGLRLRRLVARPRVQVVLSDCIDVCL